jgi:hypothetical protein
MITNMWLDAFRMIFGLAIMALHRPIASFVLRHEHVLHGMFAERGMNLPQPPTEATAHNIYFYLGMAVSVISAVRIWIALH